MLLVDSNPIQAEAEGHFIPSPYVKLLRRFGRLGLWSGRQNQDKHVPLPVGYVFEDPLKIRAAEVAGLLRQVEIGRDAGNDFIRKRRKLLHEDGFRLIDVGVRSETRQLVGFGSIAYDERFGQLGDFVVSPPHQGQGIGKAIIDERLRLAGQANIHTLTIPALEPTNTLKTYYLEKGFWETTGGELIRHSQAVVYLANSPTGD